MNLLKRKDLFPTNFLISLGLLVFSAILAIVLPSTHRLTTVIAMLFSWLGDLSLMDYRRLFSKYTPSPFVTGGLLFMTSHVFYGLAYLRLAAVYQISYFNAGFVAALVIGIAAYLSLILMGRHNNCLTSKRAILLALYAAFEIFDMACVFSCGYGLAEYRSTIRCLIAPIGIVLFVVSDYFIGMDKVANDRRLTKYIWRFYALGQLLLIIGA